MNSEAEKTNIYHELMSKRKKSARVLLCEKEKKIENGGWEKEGGKKSSYCKNKKSRWWGSGVLLRLHQLIGYYKSTSLKK